MLVVGPTDYIKIARRKLLGIIEREQLLRSIRDRMALAA